MLISFVLLFLPVNKNHFHWSPCCRLRLSRSGLPKWSMTRMMLTLRTKLTRWGTLKAFYQTKQNPLCGYKAELGQVSLPHSSMTALLYVDTLKMHLWCCDLCCHAVQNHCIVSEWTPCVDYRHFWHGVCLLHSTADGGYWKKPGWVHGSTPWLQWGCQQSHQLPPGEHLGHGKWHCFM